MSDGLTACEREFFEARNREIYGLKAAGFSVKAIARMHGLSKTRVMHLIRREGRRSNATKGTEPCRNRSASGPPIEAKPSR